MKDFRELRRTLRRNGWKQVRQRTHGIWRCPCGEHQVTISISASDRRALLNAISDLRRMRCLSLKGVLK
jgi:predicted RNA binding protein YcfA (HicA-like mRNA interferase family)